MYKVNILEKKTEKVERKKIKICCTCQLTWKCGRGTHINFLVVLFLILSAEQYANDENDERKDKITGNEKTQS